MTPCPICKETGGFHGEACHGPLEIPSDWVREKGSWRYLLPGEEGKDILRTELITVMWHDARGAQHLTVWYVGHGSVPAWA